MQTEQLLMWVMFFSALLFTTGTIWSVVRTIINRKMPGRFNRLGISTPLLFSIFLIAAVWCIRFAIGYYEIRFLPEKNKLSVAEELVHSFLAALRTVSMEEEYSQYIGSIKLLIGKVISADNCLCSFFQGVTVLYASVLNVLAPIMGGAIVLEVLTSVFPRIKLRWLYLNTLRPKYFFGELNPASLALAKSIRMTKKGENPVLIFTDTYVDDEKEKEYELLLEAKQYGAICIRDDVAHIIKPWFGKREYYLMNEDEFENLQTLMALTQKQNLRFLRKSRIYLFVRSDAHVQIEKKIKQKLQNDSGKWLFKGNNMPAIIPVNGYRNLVHNLFSDVPLYEPLVQKPDPTCLNVTILGNGSIGTEAFLCSYWLGQMMVSGVQNGKPTMKACKLNINVFSQDTHEVFWSKIDYINPEIKATVDVIGADENIPAGEVLRYQANGDKNQAYCAVQYTQADVKIGSFWTNEDQEMAQLLCSDYIIVALGSDADNISVAEKIRLAMGKKHLQEADHGAVSRAIISYAVFNPKLADTLNRHKRYQTREGETDIYMHAFGSLDEVYSCENVYMSKHSLMATETGNVYLRLKEQSVIDNECRFFEAEGGNYDYWANLARAAHIKYKVFSLGWIDRSVFSYGDDYVKVRHDKEARKQECPEILLKNTKEPYTRQWSDDYHRKYIRNICRQYKRLAIVNSEDGLDQASRSRKEDLEQKKHCLAWLEHRRWNAFTRTMGYRHMDARVIFKVKGSQKNMPMKLHACLVEARCPRLESGESYIRAGFLADGKVDTGSTFGKCEHKDALDHVSYLRYEYAKKRDKQKNRYKKADDFKTYDYYRYEFDDYLRPRELLRYVPGSEKRLIRLCQRGKFDGAFCYPDANEWHIPFQAAKSEFRKKYRQLDLSNSDDLALLEHFNDVDNQLFTQCFGVWFWKKGNITASDFPIPEQPKEGEKEYVQTAAN